jgi:ribosomal protein S18 acetylase RimI-like enzyme
MEVVLRKYNSNDVSIITKIWNEIIDEGTSFHWEEPFPEGKVEYIISTQTEVCCACVNNVPVGFYLLHPNLNGRCKHIANALYAVENKYRQKGIGTKLVKHSLEIAREHGFIGMQYNSVVESNYSIKIYEKMGFEQIGIIKNGFLDVKNNYQNLIIFYKYLE